MSIKPSAIAHAVIEQMFTGLTGVLEKAEAYAKERSIDESVMLNWRLAPDMFPMSRQVQIACEVAARGMARLAGADMPSFADTETSFAALRERIAKARSFAISMDESKVDADPAGSVSFPAGPETLTLTRQQYLLNWMLPNIGFHVTAAYANLRACGVPIGKLDYLARQ